MSRTHTLQTRRAMGMRPFVKCRFRSRPPSNSKAGRTSLTSNSVSQALQSSVTLSQIVFGKILAFLPIKKELQVPLTSRCLPSIGINFKGANKSPVGRALPQASRAWASNQPALMVHNSRGLIAPPKIIISLLSTNSKESRLSLAKRAKSK